MLPEIRFNMEAFMTQPVGQATQPVQSTSVYDAFKPYRGSAAWGTLATVVGTLINPVAGAAIAVYSVTDIGSNLIADHFNIGENNPVARIARAAFIGLASIGAAFATICALTGSAIVLTPALAGLAVSLVCFSILGTIYSAKPLSSPAPEAAPTRPAPIANPTDVQEVVSQ